MNISSPTACFDMTHWMKPEPSRIVRKWILPLERRLCSQPRSVTACPSCRAMSSMYVDQSSHRQIRAAAFRTSAARGARLLQHAGRASRCWPAPSGRCRRSRSSASSSAPRPSRCRPSKGTRWSSRLPRLSCTCVVIRCSDDRLDRVRRRRPSGTRDRSRGRCRRGAVEVPLEQRRRATARPTARSGSLRARPGRRSVPPAADLLDAAERRRAAVLAAFARSACRGGRPRRRSGSARAMSSAAPASRTAACARRGVADRVRDTAPHWSPGDEPIRDRRVDPVQREPGLVQPLRRAARSPPRRGSRNGCASRTPRPPRSRTPRSAPGDHAAQPLIVVEVCGYAEAHGHCSCQSVVGRTSHCTTR